MNKRRSAPGAVGDMVIDRSYPSLIMKPKKMCDARKRYSEVGLIVCTSNEPVVSSRLIVCRSQRLNARHIKRQRTPHIVELLAPRSHFLQR